MKIVDLGRVAYKAALELQLKAVKNYTEPVIYICEHDPPVYTAGKRLLNWAEESKEAEGLRALGAETFSTNRGGLITWHGPGQLTVYPIMDVTAYGLKRHVHFLEDLIIELGNKCGVEAERMRDIGVFTLNTKRKFGFVGVAQAHGISHHGFSVNVCNDLAWFEKIVPCGLVDIKVTSLLEEARYKALISVDHVKRVLIDILQRPIES